jgi:hypothetical protein
MVPSDDLFQLVHSMSKSEKRYFKIASKQHVMGEKNNYILMYDIIEGMKEYNQEKLKIELDKAGVKGNLSAQKAYLNKLILKSMRSFHSESTSSGRLKESLLDAEFLSTKGLYQQAAEILEKAKMEAEGLDNLIAQLEILNLEGRSKMFLGHQNLVELVETILEEKTIIIGRIAAESVIDKIHANVFALQRKHGSLFREPEKAQTLSLIAALPPDLKMDNLTPESQIKVYFLRMIRQECNGDLHESLTESQNILNVWETHPWMREEMTSMYRGALANHLAGFFKAGRMDEFPAILEKLHSIPPVNPDDEAEQFQNVAFYEFLYYFNTIELDAAVKMIPSINVGLEKFSHRMNKSRQISFRFNICLMYFFRQDWSDALKWLNSIRNEDPTDNRLDVQHLARVFELVLHYELGNFDLLESKVRSSKRFYKLYAASHFNETSVVEFFARVLKSDDEEATKSEMKKLHTMLSQSVEKGPGILECSLWLESKPSKLP